MGKLVLAFVAVLALPLGCHDVANTADHQANKQASSTEVLSPDLPYEQFCQGYEALDATLVANTYTRDAVLINVYEGSLPTSFQGRHSIDSFFVATFARALERKMG